MPNVDSSNDTPRARVLLQDGLFTASPYASAILNATDGSHVEVNAAYEALAGAGRVSLLGRTPEGIGLGVQGVTWSEALHSLQTGKTSVQLRTHSREGVPLLLCLGAVELAGQRYIQATLVPIPGEEPAAADEISGESRYRALFQNCPFVVTITRLSDGAFLDVNPTFERLSGLRQDQVLGKTPLELGLGPCAEDQASIAEILRKNGRIEVQRSFGRDPQGQKTCILYCAVVVGVGEGRQVLSVSVDLTQQLATEEALRNTEERFKGMLENAPIGIFRSTVEGKFLAANPAMCRLLGYDSESELLSNIQDIQRQLYPRPEQRDEIVQQSLSTQGYVQVHGQARRRDGKPLTTNLYVRSVRGPDREVKWLEGFLEDVTERKRAELALQESERNYREIFNATTDAIFVHSVETGEILDINEAVLRLFCLSGEEALEVKPGDPKYSLGQSPYSTVEAESWMRKAATEGPQVFDWQARKKNGELFWVEVVLRKVNIAGKARILAVVRDVTERLEAREALRSAHQRLLDTIQSLPDATFVVDQQRRVIAWNRACEELTGVKEEDMLGQGEQTYAKPFYGHRRPMLIDLLDSAQTEAESDYKYIRRSGHRVFGETFVPLLHGGHGAHLWGIATPLFDQAGARFGAVEVIRDMTEQKRAEEALSSARATQSALLEQLRQTQKLEAIGTLAGGIAHDFNNILSSMICYTELACRAKAADSQIRDDLGQVLHACARARELVRQILAFSSHAPHERKAISLEPVVKEGLKLLRASLPTTIEMDIRIEPSLPQVFADPTQVHQVLVNLCTNAAHAMREKPGRLSVALDRFLATPDAVASHPGLTLGEYVRLTVQDTGHGMDKETQRRIFEPFFTTKSPGEGTGLGLSVVHGIVRDHDGAIEVESEPGRGTVVNVYLSALGTEQPGPDVKVERVRCGALEHILLVDDELPLGRAMGRMLAKLNYRTTVRSDPQDALALFRSRPEQFDLVITDLTMPGLTGVDLAAAMRNHRPDIPVLLSSGFSGALTPERASELGLQGLLRKPVSLNDLSDAVHTALHPPGR